MNMMLEKLAFFTAMISSMTSLDCFLSDKLWAYYWVYDMFSRIFRILRIQKFFHQYFSVEKENKFTIDQRRHFSLSVLSIWEYQNKYYIIFCRKTRRFVFGKFVKTCYELDLCWYQALLKIGAVYFRPYGEVGWAFL